MCEMCSNDEQERKLAREAQLVVVRRLERTAELFKLLHRGKIDPHTEQAKEIGQCARAIIRMMSEWI